MLNQTLSDATLAPEMAGRQHTTAWIALWAIFSLAVHCAMSAPDHLSTLLGHPKGGMPPVIHCSMFFLASLPFRIMWDPLNLLMSYPPFTRITHPIRLVLFNRTFFINQGPKNIALLLNDKNLTPYFLHSTVLERAFGVPREACQIYDNDDSGPFATPRAGSNVEPRNRTDFLSRSSFHRFLTGPGLIPLCRHFEKNIQERFRAIVRPNEPYVTDDLAGFFEREVASAFIDAAYGPVLLRENPNFMDSFWTFDRNVKCYLTKVPRFLARKAYRARQDVVSAIGRWQRWTKAIFSAAEIDVDDSNVYWGSEFIRDRQNIYENMDGHDSEAKATTDLAFLWAANTNTTMSIFWYAFEVFRTPELLEAVRGEAAACLTSQSPSCVDFDTDALTRQPILQAVFAEVLRLRIHGFILRYPEKDLHINEWTFPKNNIILTCATTAHMDDRAWATAERGGKPASVFYPGRFLVEGPGKSLKFTMENTEGSWMAFGGGVHACPGRHFAKRQALYTIALLVTLFDIDILDMGPLPGMSATKFGFGLLGPSRKIAARLQRREAR